MTDCHQIIHSGLSGGAATGYHFLASAIPFEFVQCDYVKDEVYVPPVPITLNNLKD
jgi:hypothetical protein